MRSRKEDSELKMEFDHQRHLVTVWLPGEESSAILEPVYNRYKGTPYKVAVFRSGKYDLLECTTGLLLNNRG